MCSGNRQHHAREEAKREQARLDAIARERQAELDRQAAAMAAQAAAQQAERQQLEQAQQQAMAEQGRTVAALQAEEQAQQALLNQASTAQQAQIARDRLKTQAVSQSLRVLAGRDAQSKAPTAPVTRRGSQPAVKATSATQTLRIGSLGRSAGVGVNIGG